MDVFSQMAPISVLRMPDMACETACVMDGWMDDGSVQEEPHSNKISKAPLYSGKNKDWIFLFAAIQFSLWKHFVYWVERYAKELGRN